MIPSHTLPRPPPCTKMQHSTHPCRRGAPTYSIPHTLAAATVQCEALMHRAYRLEDCGQLAEAADAYQRVLALPGQADNHELRQHITQLLARVHRWAASKCINVTSGVHCGLRACEILRCPVCA